MRRAGGLEIASPALRFNEKKRGKPASQIPRRVSSAPASRISPHPCQFGSTAEAATATDRPDTIKATSAAVIEAATAADTPGATSTTTGVVAESGTTIDIADGLVSGAGGGL